MQMKRTPMTQRGKNETEHDQNGVADKTEKHISMITVFVKHTTQRCKVMLQKQKMGIFASDPCLCAAVM